MKIVPPKEEIALLPKIWLDTLMHTLYNIEEAIIHKDSEAYSILNDLWAILLYQRQERVKQYDIVHQNHYLYVTDKLYKTRD